MATIAENLERIQQAKADIKSAIEAKGVTVPSSATIDTYDDYVAQISGGGAATPSNLDAWTYDSFGKITSATIKSGATSIANNAFNGCSSLTSIDIPDSVTSIGGQAFRECEGLTSIDIPDSVTSIGDGAFYMCNNLESVTIGSGITTIRFDVFNGCTNLTSVTIQATTPPTLYANAFASTPIANGNGWIYVPEESVDAYKASSGFSAYSAVITCIGCGGSCECDQKLCGVDDNGNEFTIFDDGTDELTESDNIRGHNPVTACIGSGITTLGQNAFSDCTSLTSITIPDSVTSIGGQAFQYCGSLTSIDIPDSVTSIGDATFYMCNNLESVTIGSGITTIRFDVFNGCTNLTSVTIQATTPPTLYANAFASTPIANGNGWIYVPEESVDAYKASSDFSDYSAVITCIGCGGSCECDQKLCGVDDNGDEFTISDDGTGELTESDDIRGHNPVTACIGSGITTLGQNAFNGCTSLTSITIPDSVTSIGGQAFQYCGSLTSIDIPDSVTSIGDGAFESCTSLESVTIPDSVTSIGDFSFNNCFSLESITIEALTPPTLGYNAFGDTNNCPIYVPSEALTDYQTEWSSYTSRIQAIS